MPGSPDKFGSVGRSRASSRLTARLSSRPRPTRPRSFPRGGCFYRDCWRAFMTGAISEGHPVSPKPKKRKIDDIHCFPSTARLVLAQILELFFFLEQRHFDKFQFFGILLNSDSEKIVFNSKCSECIKRIKMKDS